MSGNRPRVTIAFIGGTGRSGSTLVSRALGSASGVCSVGELCWIWNYGLLNNRPCGCGRPFWECDFWAEVGQEGFNGWNRVDADRAVSLRRKLQRNRNVPALWRNGRRISADLAEYASLLADLYRGIHVVSGASVIVDNSKQLSAALVARAVPDVDLRVIHLVRRSHGVAYSWTKQVARADMGGKEMRRRTPARTAARWTVDNILFESMSAAGVPRVLERYEDVVDNPSGELSRILAFLGAPAAQLDFVEDRRLTLAVDHSVWGNPIRNSSGPTVVRPDEAWRTGLGEWDSRLVTALSLPGLLRFGYLPDRGR